MSQKILIHIATAPTSDCEAIEFALAMAAFDLEVRVLFSGDGLFWFQPNQQPRKTGGKNPGKLLGALAMYGVEEIACINQTTSCYPIPEGIREITSGEVREWLTTHQTVSF